MEYCLVVIFTDRLIVAIGRIDDHEDDDGVMSPLFSPSDTTAVSAKGIASLRSDLLISALSIPTVIIITIILDSVSLSSLQVLSNIRTMRSFG